MNYGVIKPKIKKEDWRVGESGIQWKEVCKDWTPYLPVYEPQEKATASQACVTFSMMNIIEAQLSQQGIEANFSDRFTAKASGTTAQGNQLNNPPYSITHDGWLYENDYPFPENMTWEEYYKEIPQTLIDKAKKNYKDANWTIQYEWLNIGNCKPDLDFLKLHLKQSPLHIATSYASGSCVPQHAMMLFKISDYLYIYDSYRGGIVKQPLSYPLPWIQKIVVVPKTPVNTIIPPITKDLRYGDRSTEVRYLQQKLIKLGYLSKGLDTGYYGPLTLLAVKKFQWEKKVASRAILICNGGNLVSTLTRKALNSL